MASCVFQGAEADTFRLQRQIWDSTNGNLAGAFDNDEGCGQSVSV